MAIHYLAETLDARQRTLQRALSRLSALNGELSHQELQWEFHDIGNDLIQQFEHILDLDLRHNLQASQLPDYDFEGNEALIDAYLDQFIYLAEIALASASAPDTDWPRERLQACLDEARLCRFPTDDFMDRPDVQESLRISEAEYAAGQYDVFTPARQ